MQGQLGYRCFMVTISIVPPLPRVPKYASYVQQWRVDHCAWQTWQARAEPTTLPPDLSNSSRPKTSPLVGGNSLLF